MEEGLDIFETDPASAAVHEELNDSDVVHVFGEFSFATCREIERTIVQSVHIGRKNVCNLFECSYLDAAGVSVLLRAQRALGPAFTIVAPEAGIVRRVLQVVGLAG